MNNNTKSNDSFFNYKILENSLNILKDNYANLADIVETVKRENPTDVRLYSRKLNQAIHNFAASIGTCIERERQFKKKYLDDSLIEESNLKIKELFSSPECKFADNLRNFILHYMLPQICWIYDADGSIKDILFQKDIFLKYDSWDKQAIKFIDLLPDVVDVLKAISCYYEAFCKFYDERFCPQFLKNN